MQKILHWLRDHFGALILAFILSFAVWVSAVVSADPNEERTLRSVDLELIGQPSDLVFVNTFPDQVRLTLNAPKSIWEQISQNPNSVRAWIDLTGIEPGEHTLEVKTQVDLKPVRFVEVEPESVRVRLESLIQREFPVELNISGELPLGYRRDNPEVQPDIVTVSGPQSAVEKIVQARVEMNISGSVETIDRVAAVQVVDNAGNPVSGVSVSPKEVTVHQPISLLGRFKNVAVKVVTTGQVANGYRLTNISISPPNVTVFSEDPDLINNLPGFVETMPVNLENLVDDAVISVGLNLPEGITGIRDPTVTVQVSVAAIESSMTLSLPLEVIGLTPDLQATISPDEIDVIIAGPLLVLDRLSKDNFLIALDLSGLPPGVYQREPEVELAPEEVRIQTTLPESVEVIIEAVPPLTATALDLTATALAFPLQGTLTITPTPTSLPSTSTPSP